MDPVMDSSFRFEVRPAPETWQTIVLEWLLYTGCLVLAIYSLVQLPADKRIAECTVKEIMSPLIGTWMPMYLASMIRSRK